MAEAVGDGAAGVDGGQDGAQGQEERGARRRRVTEAERDAQRDAAIDGAPLEELLEALAVARAKEKAAACGLRPVEPRADASVAAEGGDAPPRPLQIGRAVVRELAKEGMHPRTLAASLAQQALAATFEMNASGAPRYDDKSGRALLACGLEETFKFLAAVATVVAEGREA